MPHPKNKTFGLCACPICSGDADVRRQKNHENGKLYLSCPTCGTVRPEREFFQRWVADHMSVDGAPVEPKPAPAVTAPVTEQKPKPAPAVTAPVVAAPKPEPKPAPAVTEPEKPVVTAPEAEVTAPAKPKPEKKPEPETGGGFFDRLGGCL